MQTKAILYDSDFFEWTQDTAEKIRAGRFDEIDRCALAEEIEDLGKRDRRAVYAALVQLLSHLLKWHQQPEYRERAGETSWRVSIVKQRQELRREFKDSPSLKRYAQEDLGEAYLDAVKLVVAETGMERELLPSECPFTHQQILDEDFFPGADS